MASQNAKQHNGCDGPDSLYIKLISRDGHEFIIKREYVTSISPVIKGMLDGVDGPSVRERSEIGNIIHFNESLYPIESHLLKKLCEFFTHKAECHLNQTDSEFKVELEFTRGILLASDFLLC